MAATSTAHRRTGRAPRSAGALVAVALHAVVGALLLSHEPARSALTAALPIMVDLITPARVEPKPEPPVEIEAPKPKPRPKPKSKPMISAPIQEPEAPAPIVAPALPPELPTEPPAPEPEAVAVTPAPQPTPATAPPPQPVPLAVVPPVFNAEYLKNPPPAYPPLSRRLGEQGRVVLHVLVGPAGSADEVQISASSGHPRLDQAARDTVRRWKFVPARRGPQPVAAWVLVPISFRLEG